MHWERFPKVEKGDENWRMNQTIQTTALLRSDLNTKKISVNLRWIAVTQTPETVHLLTLVWQTCKEYNNNMHNPAPVLENNTHKLLWDFDICTDHLITARRPDLIIINKKREHAINVKRRISTSTLLGNWKTMEHAGDNYTNCNWCVWNSN